MREGADLARGSRVHMKPHNRGALAVAAFVLCACRETTPPGTPSATIAGKWTFASNLMIGPEDGCNAYASYVVAQSGSTFTATAVSFVGGCARPLPIDGRIVDGVVGRDGVAFTIASCRHVGQFVGGSTDSLAGTFMCADPRLPGTGTWSATRLGAATSISLDVGSRVIVVGGLSQLTAVERDDAGHVVFGDPVSWTSDAPSVASVSSSGLVSGVAPGRMARITAQSGSLSATALFDVRTVQFTSVAAGVEHSCGITSSGDAFCWGAAPLGDGLELPSATPVGVRNSAGFTALTAGAGYTCGVLVTLGVQCWGTSPGGVVVSSAAPAPVVGGPQPYVAVSAGVSHACVLDATGLASCWGDNTNGQLGDGGTLPMRQPVGVLGNLHFSALTVNTDHSCALTAQGAAYCWGANSSGALGDGTTEIWSTVPVPVGGGIDFVELSAGGYGACGVAAGGIGYCWGRNEEGQLGIGSADANPHPLPVPIGGGITFVAISSSFYFRCGLSSDGTAYCWGVNSSGQLGDGTTLSRTAPVQVAGGLHFTSISVGNMHACAIARTGVTYCWGSNAYSQLGDGTATMRTVPTAVVGQSVP